MTNKKTSPKRTPFDPRRVALGWKLLWTSLGLWLFGLILSPVSSPMKLLIGIPLRLKILIFVAALQLAVAILAAVWLWPIVRRRRLRLWSIVLVVLLIGMSSLYHFAWLSRLGV
ncbi:MAG: hypothetical protein ABIO68_02540 [Sphingomicrobium sp.]